MRKIVGTVFVSLDGVMQAPGGVNEDITGGFKHGGWQFKFPDPAADATLGAAFDGYDLLLGRRTYDIFAAYWPYVEGEEAQLGETFTNAGKYVLTRGDQPLEWENSHRLKGMDDVATLKQGDGPDLMIWGSSEIYPGLLSAGLLDRLTVMIYPLTLGDGKRLFGDGTPAGALKMVDHQVTPAGTIIATYEPVGPIPDGASVPPIDTAREAERQRRMQEGTW
ncbi:dihydrofolate reductase family protein [Sphingomonas asaccharolytica]|uniref:dihydrofolate reductase family protein n=1 Tax=Sphingomonas asaccharolytica TaxID=40681 RepID=UPI0008373E84|nr:dihydrofolate reductase family protein [Sphingomonas asaccharolytica]